MFAEKQKVLQDIVILNKPDQPWQLVVEGDTIVASWKWMDARFFSLSEVTDSTKAYSFRVTLKDNGKWKEFDQTSEETSKVNFRDGKLEFGKSSFGGAMTEKSFTFGLGQDKQTGQSGLIGFKFDTSAVKKPIRDYLTSCGWKKAGLFG